MPENSITRKVKIMSKLKNIKNVQHNDLIMSVAKMDKIPLKIFELAVSCINPENPPENNTIYLSKEDLFMFFEVTDSNKHARFKESIEKMQKQAYFVINDREGEGMEFESIIPIPYIKWNDYNDEVVFEFNRHIMPYLIEVKQNFTQYAISEIIDLSSKYSIILYKWLSMNYNQYNHYKIKGNRTNGQLESLKNPIIKVSELRRITDTIEEYPRFTNFDSYVIKNALEEINTHTQLNVTYEKIKKGRKINLIKFYIEKEHSYSNEFYKEEQQDPEFLEEQEKESEEEENLYNAAMESNYTTILGEYSLITIKDIQDKEIMAGLQKNVFPLYDQLEQQKGAGSVEKHVSYVASRMESYSKRNIVRYLQVAIDNYLSSFNNNPYK